MVANAAVTRISTKEQPTLSGARSDPMSPKKKKPPKKNTILDAAPIAAPITLHQQQRDVQVTFGLSQEAQAFKEQLIRSFLALFERLDLTLTLMLHEFAQRLAAPPTPLVLPEPRPHLTRREIEIVALMSKHLSNEQIADALHIEPNTVRTHRRNIKQKLGHRDQVLFWWEQHQHEYASLLSPLDSKRQHE